ncbi:MAG: hypothetical protein E7198_09280 [Schwartzia succinivorans]|uniref:lecithin retinol acyltransferase family protein n=1 Tax=Schwartzia succinivorans TaxID=55507 RepID=UPI002355EFFB|nr:lecithin retinol acyltransferase family protein [Schwartzia succinivorans]MBE6097972.1 hypothetical protein [Schwartzia succinivorans]
MGWFDLTDGESYPLGNKRTFDRDDLKAMERCLGKIYKPAGKALEKVNNQLDSLQNLAEATNPAVRIYDALKSYSIEEAYEKLRKGDHIYVNRSVYSHHGIYDGEGFVYEYQDFFISCSSLEAFARGDGILVKNEKAAYSPDEIIRRAQSRFGENEYNLFENNCENFATWCRCGMEKY